MLPMKPDEASRARCREKATRQIKRLKPEFRQRGHKDRRARGPQPERFMKPEDLWPEGYSTLYVHGNTHPFPETWTPYTAAESWKKTGPVERFYDATDLDGLVYRLGMAEGLYYQDTGERQRRGRPADEPGDRRCCGGYIVWKCNDSWPSVYSAKVDYFLEPYHAYYALRRACAPVLLSFEIGTFRCRGRTWRS